MPRSIRCLSILTATILAPAAFGAVISQTVSLPGYPSGNLYDSTAPGSPGTAFLDGAPLDSFNKFDASLGTLTEIRVIVEIDATWDLFSAIDPFTQMLDPGEPFFIDFSLGGDLEAGVFYQPTGAGVLVSAATEGYNSTIQLLHFGDSFFNTTGTGDSFGEFGISGSPTVGSIVPGVNDTNSADFIGTGTVEGLQLGFLVPADDSWFLDNLSDATMDFSYELAPGDVTLEYHYDAIPEPSVILLLGAGAIGSCRRRRH